MGIVTVIGGVNIDVQGFPARDFAPDDSNPGMVVMTPGGVGRNIAENLARLGQRVRFISAFGGDSYARIVLESLSDAGVDASLSVVSPDRTSSMYLCILDQYGALRAAVSDMALMEELTPSLIERCRTTIEESDLCVIDTNLPKPTIDHICATFPGMPIVLDTVSAAKAPRALDCLASVTAVKPNRREAAALTGLTLNGDRDLPVAAESLHKSGTPMVFISLGREGMFFSTTGSYVGAHGIARSPDTNTVNASGAGDAATAGIAYALSRGEGAVDAARYAVAAAALAAEAPQTVNPRMSEASLREKARGIQVET